MTAALFIYLEDPAHRESPEQAQLPSVTTLLGEFLRCPGGGDVMQRRDLPATGPGTDSQKTSVRTEDLNM